MQEPVCKEDYPPAIVIVSVFFVTADLRDRCKYPFRVRDHLGHCVYIFYSYPRIPVDRRTLPGLLLLRQNLCFWQRASVLAALPEGQPGEVQPDEDHVERYRPGFSCLHSPCSCGNISPDPGIYLDRSLSCPCLARPGFYWECSRERISGLQVLPAAGDRMSR